MHKCIAVLGVEFQSVYSIHRATVLAVSFEVLHTKGSYSLYCQLFIYNISISCARENSKFLTQRDSYFLENMINS